MFVSFIDSKRSITHGKQYFKIQIQHKMWDSGNWLDFELIAKHLAIRDAIHKIGFRLSFSIFRFECKVIVVFTYHNLKIE